MVTKHTYNFSRNRISSVLAKIHMVTKLRLFEHLAHYRSVLAKIHMVTKPVMRICWLYGSSVLAKIHMVTKPFASSSVALT